VRGVAQLDGLMYVVCRPNTLHVYDSVSFVQLKEVLVQLEGRKSSHLYDIAACSINHCLYVSDIKNRCILRLTSVVTDVVKWLDTGVQVTKHVVYILLCMSKYNTLETIQVYVNLFISRCVVLKDNIDNVLYTLCITQHDIQNVYNTLCITRCV